MIKKLIAFSVVLLLPVSFISPASAASKSITCYKGTASKVVMNSSGKCPMGWTSKNPVTPKTPAKTSNTSYKIKNISPNEVATIIDVLSSLNEFKKQDWVVNEDCTYKDEVLNRFKSKISDIEGRLVSSNRDLRFLQGRLVDPKTSESDKKTIQENIDNTITNIKSGNDKLAEAKANLQEKTVWLSTCEKLIPKSKIELEKYFPKVGSTSVKIVTNKLVDNFCGLNILLLTQNEALLTKADPMIGYEKYSQTVMKQFYGNLVKIQENSKVSINTQNTDSILEIIYPDIQVYYGKEASLYEIGRWESTLVKSEYGVSVVSPDFNLLKDKLQKTASFCKTR